MSSHGGGFVARRASRRAQTFAAQEIDKARRQSLSPIKLLRAHVAALEAVIGCSKYGTKHDISSSVWNAHWTNANISSFVWFNLWTICSKQRTKQPTSSHFCFISSAYLNSLWTK